MGLRSTRYPNPEETLLLAISSDRLTGRQAGKQGCL